MQEHNHPQLGCGQSYNSQVSTPISGLISLHRIRLGTFNYPRSKGLFQSLPQRQTMVLLTDNTIRELCSRTTPTSQFSSLHFIASTAIGAKSIETLAQALHSCFLGFVCLGMKPRRRREPHWRAFWRRLANWQRVLYTYGRPSGDYLTGGAAAATASKPRAAVGGDRARTSPVTSLLCYGDLTPHCESPTTCHSNLHSVVTNCKKETLIYRSY